MPLRPVSSDPAESPLTDWVAKLDALLQFKAGAGRRTRPDIPALRERR